MSWRSLTRQREFKEVYERGIKKVGRFLVVYLFAADDLAYGVVASRKVGKAVRRNRAKRLLREARRLGILGSPEGVAGIRARFFPDSGKGPAAEPGPAGLWVVLVARQAILEASSRDVTAELDRLLDGSGG
ncbi:MAG: ribonuclease P protein component [bacterium]|nr:ribonuclease P protein component [bacterium]